MNNDSQVMILPVICPHCNKAVVVRLEVPTPLAEVFKPEEMPDNIRDLINENVINPQEPDA